MGLRLTLVGKTGETSLFDSILLNCELMANVYLSVRLYEVLDNGLLGIYDQNVSMPMIYT